MASSSTTALSLLSTSLTQLTKPAFLNPTRPHLLTLTRIKCSSPTQFNITFAPPKPKPEPERDPSTIPPFISPSGTQLIIPWIVRGEDGNLRIQAEPPEHLVKAMAVTDVKPKQSKKKKKDKEGKREGVKGEARVGAGAGAGAGLSKAARRFYNENVRESEKQRLSKVLAAAGVASRRSCEELIFDGKVTVNGDVCNAPQTRVNPWRDVIYVNGNRLPKKLPPKVYLALNKPKGYICSAGEKETKSVLSLFDDYWKRWEKTNSGLPKPRLFTVGRLDVNTSGLIIVTNDGNFAQSISHPSHNLSKEYIATVDGEVNKRHLLALSEGTNVDGVHCTPDSVELLPKQPDMPRPRLRIVVHEGRNHEVRELVKNAGLEIHALKRVRIGGFRLPTELGLGKHMELKPKDLQALGWKS